jgi:hypothetical protein
VRQVEDRNLEDIHETSWPEERAGTGWPAQPRPGHPLVAGAVCLALAVGAWYGLLWGFTQKAQVGGTAPTRVGPGLNTGAPAVPDTGRVVLGPRTSPPPLPHVPAAPRSSPKPSMRKIVRDSAPKIVRDSAPQPKMSPFRRSHPWAASSEGQYYYPSNCLATLQLPDLVFFTSEAEARASGFLPSRLPGCE